jgi:hypothetical protein
MKTVTDEEIGRAAVEWARSRRAYIKARKAVSDCERFEPGDPEYGSGNVLTCLAHNLEDVLVSEDQYGEKYERQPDQVELCPRCAMVELSRKMKKSGRAKLEGLLRSALNRKPS